MTKLALNPYWDAHPIDEMKKEKKRKKKKTCMGSLKINLIFNFKILK
jgi:hypothetical protein